eukprot:jgi/Chlat1/7070/Chrsp57S06727
MAAGTRRRQSAKPPAGRLTKEAREAVLVAIPRSSSRVERIKKELAPFFTSWRQLLAEKQANDEDNKAWTMLAECLGKYVTEIQANNDEEAATWHDICAILFDTWDIWQQQGCIAKLKLTVYPASTQEVPVLVAALVKEAPSLAEGLTSVTGGGKSTATALHGHLCLGEWFMQPSDRTDGAAIQTDGDAALWMIIQSPKLLLRPRCLSMLQARVCHRDSPLLLLKLPDTGPREHVEGICEAPSAAVVLELFKALEMHLNKVKLEPGPRFATVLRIALSALVIVEDPVHRSQIVSRVMLENDFELVREYIAADSGLRLECRRALIRLTNRQVANSHSLPAYGTGDGTTPPALAFSRALAPVAVAVPDVVVSQLVADAVHLEGKVPVVTDVFRELSALARYQLVGADLPMLLVTLGTLAMRSATVVGTSSDALVALVTELLTVYTIEVPTESLLKPIMLLKYCILPVISAQPASADMFTVLRLLRALIPQSLSEDGLMRTAKLLSQCSPDMLLLSLAALTESRPATRAQEGERDKDTGVAHVSLQAVQLAAELLDDAVLALCTLLASDGKEVIQELDWLPLLAEAAATQLCWHTQLRLLPLMTSLVEPPDGAQSRPTSCTGSQDGFPSNVEKSVREGIEFCCIGERHALVYIQQLQLAAGLKPGLHVGDQSADTWNWQFQPKSPSDPTRSIEHQLLKEMAHQLVSASVHDGWASFRQHLLSGCAEILPCCTHMESLRVLQGLVPAVLATGLAPLPSSPATGSDATAASHDQLRDLRELAMASASVQFASQALCTYVTAADKPAAVDTGVSNCIRHIAHLCKDVLADCSAPKVLAIDMFGAICAAMQAVHASQVDNLIVIALDILQVCFSGSKLGPEATSVVQLLQDDDYNLANMLDVQQAENIIQSQLDTLPHKPQALLSSALKTLQRDTC